MPRTPEEKRAAAIKYGRRQRVLAAKHSEQTYTDEIGRLIRELRATQLPKARVETLLADLERYTDVKRRNAAVWAIIDALEDAARG